MASTRFCAALKSGKLVEFLSSFSGTRGLDRDDSDAPPYGSSPGAAPPKYPAPSCCSASRKRDSSEGRVVKLGLGKSGEPPPERTGESGSGKKGV